MAQAPLGFPPFPALQSFFGMRSLHTLSYSLYLKCLSQFRTLAPQKEDLEWQVAAGHIAGHNVVQHPSFCIRAEGFCPLMSLHHLATSSNGQANALMHAAIGI